MGKRGLVSRRETLWGVHDRGWVWEAEGSTPVPTGVVWPGVPTGVASPDVRGETEGAVAELVEWGI